MTCNLIARLPHAAGFMLVVITVLATPVHAARVDVTLEGVEDVELVENIEATASIMRKKGDKTLTDAQIERMHERAPTEIERALAPFGYYRVEVEGALVRRSESRYTARYVVTLGEPVRVRRVNVSVAGPGREQLPFPRLVAEFPLRAGDVLNQRSYERRKATFASIAADSGYLDAGFTTSKILIDREGSAADIDVVFDTGPRYKFGPVLFDSTAVQERVLRAHVPFERGDPFRYDQMLALQSSLGSTPYFSRVEVAPRRDLASGLEVPIQVSLALSRPRRYEIGVGYGTDTGPRVLLNVELRRLNAAGHRFDGRANVSEVELSLRAEYFVPSRYPDTHAYSLGAQIARLDPVAYETLRTAIGPTRSQRRLGALESITLTYEREDYSVASDNGVTNLVILGAAYRWKRANDDISPSRGYRVDLAARGSHGGLLSSQSFISFTGSFKGIRSAGGRIRLIGRVDGGYTSTSTFRDLPPTIRFFTGGDNTVRGYEYQSLGPTDEDGHVVGGWLLLVTSAEVEFGLGGKLALATFYDGGNAFESVYRGTFEQGVGAGVRWRSPVGPVRLDVAFPVRHDGVHVHFTMGPDL